MVKPFAKILSTVVVPDKINWAWFQSLCLFKQAIDIQMLMFEVKMLFFIGNSCRLLCVDYKNILYHNSILVTLKTNLATYAA